jgi:multicomponent Na+:H+ antiporter subunit E
MIRNLAPRPVENVDRCFMRKAGLRAANSLTIAAPGIPRSRGLAGARLGPGLRQPLEGALVTRGVSLGFILFGLWFALSGHTELLLLGFGAASSVVIVLIAWRLGILDHEAVPLQLGLRFIGFWAWLAGQIVKANLEVTRLVVSPRAIDPRLVRVKATQRSDMGRVIHANSITLTPGTVSVEIEGNEILVHALTPKFAETTGLDALDRRVSALEGPSRD